MKYRSVFSVLLTVVLLSSVANAQRAEMTVSLNEAFFDELLDSVFRNFEPPEFSIAEYRLGGDNGRLAFAETNVTNSADLLLYGYTSPKTVDREATSCSESVKIQREINGVRTAVRFREGKIYVPLAFSGNYAPPLIGCVDFAGWAETNIDLEFDSSNQRLIGRARVLNVNLNGTGGVGGSLIAKLIQGSIDKKLNPIEIIRMDKASFVIPIQNTGSVKMNATGIRSEVGNGNLKIHVEYEFLKN